MSDSESDVSSVSSSSEEKPTEERLMSQVLKALKTLSGERDPKKWNRSRVVGHAEEDDDNYTFTEEFLTCPYSLAKGGKVSLENLYKTTNGYLNGTKIELYRANQWKCYYLFIKDGPVHWALTNDLTKFDDEKNHPIIYEALKQYRTLLDDVKDGLKNEQIKNLLLEALAPYTDERLDIKYDSKDKKIKKGDGGAVVTQDDIQPLIEIFFRFGLNNWVGKFKQQDETNEIYQLLYFGYDNTPQKIDDSAFVWHSYTNPYTREELFKAAPVMSGHVMDHFEIPRAFGVAAREVQEYVQAKAEYKPPKGRREYGEVRSIFKYDSQGIAFNWMYTYIFKFDTVMRDEDPGHPFSFNNLSVDALDEFFIRPLQVKSRVMAGLTGEERKALRAYEKYRGLLFAGSPDRKMPEFSEGYDTRFNIFGSKGFYENEREDTNNVQSTRNKYRGRKWRPAGMFNIFKEELKYDKIREALLDLHIVKRISYLYYCMHSLTSLAKLVVNSEMDTKARKVWNKYIAAKLAILIRFLDEKGNWSKKEIDAVNRNNQGHAMALVWMDTYASARFIEQLLVTNKSKPKNFEFFPTAPDPNVLQTYNEDMKSYRDQFLLGEKDADQTLALSQICSAKGIKVNFFDKEYWKPVKNPVTYINGKPKMSKELEMLYRKGRLHAECVGLLVASPKDLEEKDASAATVSLPDYLSLSDVSSLLRNSFPFLTESEDGGLVAFDVKKMVAEIKGDARRNRDTETAETISDFLNSITGKNKSVKKNKKAVSESDDDDDDDESSQSGPYGSGESYEDLSSDSSATSSEEDKTASQFLRKGGDKRSADTMKRSGYLKKDVADRVSKRDTELPYFKKGKIISGRPSSRRSRYDDDYDDDD